MQDGSVEALLIESIDMAVQLADAPGRRFVVGAEGKDATQWHRGSGKCKLCCRRAIGYFITLPALIIFPSCQCLLAST
jgi:hypothetical protein